MTAAVGPRSALILPGRVGRLLDPGSQQTPLYRLTSGAARRSGRRPRRARGGVGRDGRSGTSTRWSCPGDGARFTRRSISGARVPLFVRGVLVVLLDAAVLGLLWFVAELVAGLRLRPPRWRSLARSFRIRLAVTLGAFFLLPAVGFAAWSFARLGRRGGAQPRPADHPDAAGRGAHRRRPHSRWQSRARRAAARPEPPDRRGPCAVRRRPAGRNQHAGAGGSRA